jgi:N-acetylglucosaminyl-diphospho-decaprenol L-rhamnosyltransferase
MSDRVRAMDCEGTPVRVSAVIVTHARPDLAAQAIAHMADAVPRPEIVVVVNDPEASDASALISLEACAGQVIRNDVPRGYGANLNRGVAALEGRGDALLLLNDDAFLQPGALARLIAVLARNPCAGIVGGQIITNSMSADASAFKFPTLWSEAAAILLAPEPLLRRARHRWLLDMPSGSDGRVEWVLGAAMLVRRTAFEAAGGFDEAFFLYSEETDLAKRMSDAGWTTHLTAAAEIVHVGAASTEAPRFPQMRREARGRYVRKHWPRPQQWALNPVLSLVVTWNLVYVLAQSIVSPGSRRRRIARWRLHRDGRPILPDR